MTAWSYYFPDVMARVLKLWPGRIDVTERIGESPLEGHGMRFPALADVAHGVQADLLAQGDDFAATINWKLYTTLHNIARRQSVVFPPLVHHGYVKALFERDLSGEVLEGFREDYWKQNPASE